MKHWGIFALALCLLLCGCASQEVSAPPLAMTDLEVTPAPAKEMRYPVGDQKPLVIERGSMENENGYILYPKVLSGAHAQRINETICHQVTQCAAELGTQVFTEYRIEHNDHGLFSILIYVLDLHTDELLAQLPMTFDCAAGNLCDLAYFFDSGDPAWRQALARRIEQSAAEADITLLREVEQVADTQAYYIYGDTLVILYRLYEISTYSAGRPEFEIPIEDIQAYLAPQSPLLRLKVQ